MLQHSFVLRSFYRADQATAATAATTDHHHHHHHHLHHHHNNNNYYYYNNYNNNDNNDNNNDDDSNNDNNNDNRSSMPSTAVPSDPHSKLWDVGKETELRILCRGTAVVVTLQKGVAEVFGAEMKMLMPYTFHDTSVAIFSWYGAQIKVTHVVEDASNSASAASSSGSSSALATLSSSAAAAGTGSHGDESEASFFVYEEARSHMMQDYVQLHGKVDEIRVDALSDAEVGGPRVIVIGPPNSGKSSLVRLLCSYAVRMSRAPLFVDLDTGAGDASMPGSIVASPVDMRCVSVERGLLARYPLAFYYGHSSPTANADLFKHQVDALSKVVERCLEKNQVWVNGRSDLFSLVCGSRPTLVFGFDTAFACVTVLSGATQFWHHCKCMRVGRRWWGILRGNSLCARCLGPCCQSAQV